MVATADTHLHRNTQVTHLRLRLVCCMYTQSMLIISSRLFHTGWSKSMLIRCDLLVAMQWLRCSLETSHYHIFGKWWAHFLAKIESTHIVLNFHFSGRRRDGYEFELWWWQWGGFQWRQRHTAANDVKVVRHLSPIRQMGICSGGQWHSKWMTMGHRSIELPHIARTEVTWN